MRPRGSSGSGQLVQAIRLAALAAVYVGLGRMALGIEPIGRVVTLVWPPAGLSLAALVLFGPQLWPAVAAGAVLTNFLSGAPPLVACTIALGNTLEALAGALALRSIRDFRPALDRFADVAALAALGAVVSTAVSATIGTASLVLGGVIAPAAIPLTLSVWWAGDLVSDLLVAPAILTWACGPRVALRPAAVLETCAMALFLGGVATLVFLVAPGVRRSIPALQPSLLVVPMTWAALRHGPRGAATGIFMVGVVAVTGTYLGRGPFVGSSRFASLFALDSFLASASLAFLTLGAVVSDRERSHRALAERETELRAHVAAQTQVAAERADLLVRERAARAEAEAATRAKDEFLAVLSHELRSPLQSMLGWTQMLRTRRLDETTAAKGLATIERNVRAQTRLIEDLLDVSRIIAGKLRLEPRPMDPSLVVEAALASARLAARAKAIDVDAEIAPCAGPILGDPNRLEQAVSNLLSNAVKFTPPGGRVLVRLVCSSAFLTITVEDTGPGIPDLLVPHVFDRFRQADSSAQRAHGGLGLGLAIVRHVVELHRGTVKAEGHCPAGGAKFTIELPVVSARHRAVRVPAEEGDVTRAAREAQLAGVRILVVDDDPDACELLETALHDSGAVVQAVGSAKAALSAIGSFAPDVLVSDIGMPEEDGYTLIHQIRQDEQQSGRHLPAIALTAFASSADRELALARGFETHLAKPASAVDLTKAAAALVGRRVA